MNRHQISLTKWLILMKLFYFCICSAILPDIGEEHYDNENSANDGGNVLNIVSSHSKNIYPCTGGGDHNNEKEVFSKGEHHQGSSSSRVPSEELNKELNTLRMIKTEQSLLSHSVAIGSSDDHSNSNGNGNINGNNNNDNNNNNRNNADHKNDVESIEELNVQLPFPNDLHPCPPSSIPHVPLSVINHDHNPVDHLLPSRSDDQDQFRADDHSRMLHFNSSHSNNTTKNNPSPSPSHQTTLLNRPTTTAPIQTPPVSSQHQTPPQNDSTRQHSLSNSSSDQQNSSATVHPSSPNNITDSTNSTVPTSDNNTDINY
ncbi:unnamed protein product, partial [Anisakis simplex]|uniref:GATA zinc finger domain-containing protein 14-like n=1 Tax=Anisakis simplex TaxID=6269 RepID=A0A0M3JBJ4_ANISI